MDRLASVAPFSFSFPFHLFSFFFFHDHFMVSFSWCRGSCFFILGNSLVSRLYLLSRLVLCTFVHLFLLSAAEIQSSNKKGGKYGKGAMETIDLDKLGRGWTAGLLFLSGVHMFDFAPGRVVYVIYCQFIDSIGPTSLPSWACMSWAHGVKTMPLLLVGHF
jgi:hypothetical protein